MQCWTEGAHSLHGQSPRRKQRVLHSTLISASRFLLEKSQVRSLEIHPTRLGARAQRRASVIYSHTHRICLSHRYGASRSTSHLSKQHQWTTRAHCSDTVGRVTHARTLALAASARRLHTYGARIAATIKVAEIRVTALNEERQAYICVNIPRSPHVCATHFALVGREGAGGSRGEKGEGGTASSVKVWLKRNATDGG